MNDKLTEWMHFLDTCPDTVKTTWYGILAAIPDISLPVVDDKDNGSLAFTWSNDRYRLDIEVLYSGLIHWFYRDRETGELCGSLEPLHSVPNKAVQLLAKIKL